MVVVVVWGDDGLVCCGGAGGSLTGLTGSGGGSGDTHLFSIWEKFFPGWAGGLEECILCRNFLNALESLPGFFSRGDCESSIVLIT